jgi:uncharacterized protein YfaA (DUF2138 family)
MMVFADLPIGSIWRPSSAKLVNVFTKDVSENNFEVDKAENIFELGFFAISWYADTNSLAPAICAKFSLDRFVAVACDDLGTDVFSEGVTTLRNIVTLDQSDNEINIE